MNINKRDVGQKGEQIALKYLKSKGYKILETNYRCQLGEIDIIARNKRDLVFLEVRSKMSEDFGLPRESITYRKQQRLMKIALSYLQHKELTNQNYRFDVVEVILDTTGRRKSIELIPNALPLQSIAISL